MSVTLSVNSPTGQTPQRIFTVDSLNTRIYTRMCLLGSPWWIITFRGSKSPKTPISEAWIGISSQICQQIQIAISSDLCIILAWNLTGSCGQQQRLCGCSRMVVKHFENRYVAISQRKIIRFWWNFVHSSRFWTGWTSPSACLFVLGGHRSHLQTLVVWKCQKY